MFVAHASYNLSSFGIPRMISFSLADLRPRHVRRPSAAHSRFGGEVHARRKVWRARKLAHLKCSWPYSLRYLPARTIYLSARGTELYCFLTTVFVTTLCRARHKLKPARTLHGGFAAALFAAYTPGELLCRSYFAGWCCALGEVILWALLHAFRVCLKRNNSQVRVDFASVQGRNPKA